MKNSPAKVLSLVALLAAIALITMAPSCQGPVVSSWNVVITKKTPASIEVDLVGVTAAEKRFYEGVTMEDYWKSGSSVRRDADKLSQILQLDQPWTVSASDPQLQAWLRRGVQEVLLIADLPGSSGLWKVTLPLDKKAWDSKSEDYKQKTLKINILETRIEVMTPRKAGR